MSFTLSSIAPNLNAMQWNLNRMERDANVVATPASPDPPAAAPADAAPASPPQAPPADDMGAAMVDLMMAQRAFAAQLRVIQLADKVAAETLGIADHRKA